MKIEIFVTDVEEYEELFAEAWIDHELWCELSQEGGPFAQRFFPRADSVLFKVELDLAFEIIDHMKKYLRDGNAWKDRPEWHPHVESSEDQKSNLE